MHRIRRHCRIGQSVTGPIDSAGLLGSRTREHLPKEMQAEEITAEFDRSMHPMEDNHDARLLADDIPYMAALFSIPSLQILPPDELKYVEIILFQTKILYESYAQSRAASKMTESRLVYRAETQSQMTASPYIFVRKAGHAVVSLKLCRSKAEGWRFLHEAMDMIRPMLASKHPDSLRILLRHSYAWESLYSPEIYRVIWNQISEMAFIVLGKNDPFSKSA
jgi:hypothetical protein